MRRITEPGPEWCRCGHRRWAHEGGPCTGTRWRDKDNRSAPCGCDGFVAWNDKRRTDVAKSDT